MEGRDRNGARREVASADALLRAGDGAGAEEAYRRALRLDRDAADAWHGLGALALGRGFAAEAVALLRRALAARPRTAHYHLSLGSALLALGEAEGARAAFAVAALLEPADRRAHAALGGALARLGRLNEAKGALGRAVALAPDDRDGERALAVLELATGAPDRAAERFVRLDAARPLDAPALANWGAALQLLGRFDEADTVLGRALDAAPPTVEALSNRGLARLGLGRLDAALDDLREARRLAPDDAAVRRNLASAHFERDERDEARALLDDVLRRDPADRDALLNRGTLDLAEGRLADGWRGYRARPGTPGWSGEELAGRTLRIEAEQGLGDTVMFLRYVPLAARLAGAAVELALPRALHRIARGTEGVGRVVEIGDTDDGDGPVVRARVGDLAAMFSPDPSAIAAPARVAVEPDLVRAWRGRLDAELGRGRPIVGLAWSGNPSYRQDRRRSVAPSRLAPLPGDARFAFVSLQPGRALDGAPAPLPADADLADTAALLRCLDAVVTADTLVVHLAGSLGVPTLLLDRVGGDWRWGRNRSDTPWYPSVTICRDDASREPEDAFEEAVALAHRLLVERHLAA